MDITKRIKLDFMCPPYPIVVYAKQGDSGTRFIEVEPLAYGEKYTIPSGVSAKFACKKPDGSYLINNDITISGNIIRIPLTRHILNISGSAQCAVVLYETASDKILTTQNFTLSIEKTPYTDAPSGGDLPEYSVVSFPKPDDDDDNKIVVVKGKEFTYDYASNVFDVLASDKYVEDIMGLNKKIITVNNSVEELRYQVEQNDYVIESLIEDLETNIGRQLFYIHTFDIDIAPGDVSSSEEIKDRVAQLHSDIYLTSCTHHSCQVFLYLTYNGKYYPASFYVDENTFSARALIVNPNNTPLEYDVLTQVVLQHDRNMGVGSINFRDTIGDKGIWLKEKQSGTDLYLRDIDDLKKDVYKKNLATNELVGHAIDRALEEVDNRFKATELQTNLMLGLIETRAAQSDLEALDAEVEELKSSIGDKASSVHILNVRTPTYDESGNLDSALKDEIKEFHKTLHESISSHGRENVLVYLRKDSQCAPATFVCNSAYMRVYGIDFDASTTTGLNDGARLVNITYNARNDVATIELLRAIGDTGDWLTWYDEDANAYTNAVSDLTNTRRATALATNAVVGHALDRSLAEVRDEFKQKIGDIPTGGEITYDSVVDYVNKITAGVATSGAMEGLANRINIIESDYITEDELNTVKEQIKNEVASDTSNIFVIETPRKNIDGTYSDETIQKYQAMFEEIFEAVNPVVMFRDSDNLYPAYVSRQNIAVGITTYVYTATAYKIDANNSSHYTTGVKIELLNGHLTVTHIDSSVGDDGSGKVYDKEEFLPIAGGYKNLEFDLGVATNNVVYHAIEGAFDMEFIFDGGTAEDVMDVE